MSLQSWSSKGGTLKRWMCLWSDLGRTRVLAEIPNITRYYKAKKKTRQRAYATHQSFTNFWWLEFLGGIHFSKGSAVHEKVASHLALFWIPYIDMDMCTVPPQLPPHWNFTATPQYNSRRQSLKHHFGFSVSNSQKSSSHSSLVW